MAAKKPLLVCSAFAGEGHFNPVLEIARYMVKNGYEACFVAFPNFKPQVEEAGIEYIETPAIFSEDTFKMLAHVKATVPPGIKRFAVELGDLVPGTLPGRVERFHEVLEMLRARDPTREMIILEDAFNHVSMPFKFGRPLPQGFDKLPPTVGIGCTPLLLESQDIGPILSGLPPDSTESGRLRNKYIHDLMREGPMKYMIDKYSQSMRDCGCTSIPEIKIWNTGYEAYDVVFQMCSPSLEFPLSDLPSVIEFAGVLPRQEAERDATLPAWWSEITDTKAKEDRQIVFISQGTVTPNYAELLIPSMEALGDRDDLLIIVTLGSPGASLPQGTHVPANTRVTDYIPYDLILVLADIFVTNGGYGAFTHAIRNGCPMVIAGGSQEKTDVVQRAVYAGVGLSLGTNEPSTQQVREGVDHLLNNDQYKRRALQLRKENEEMDPLEKIRQRIEGLTR